MCNSYQWPLACLSEIADVYGGGTPSREEPAFWNGHIPWLTPGELTGDDRKMTMNTHDRITDSGIRSSATVEVPVGALLVTTRATLGLRTIAGIPMATNQGFKSLIFDRYVADPEFYYHLFGTLTGEMKRRASGTTFLEISGGQLGAIKVPVPPLAEQHRIVEILDVIDDQIVRVKSYLSKLIRQRDGVALSLCVDADWPAVCVGDVLDASRGSRIQTGPFGSQLHAYDYVADGRPVVMPQDIVGGEISTEQISTVGPHKISELSRHGLRQGDIVFSRRGDLGRCAVVTSREVGWLCGTGCLLIRTGDVGLLPGWLSLAYRGWRCQQQVAARAVGSTMQNLNTGILERLVVRLPPVEEQRRILAVTDKCQSACGETEAQIFKLKVLKQALMDDLLTGRVRVPVGDGV